MAQRDYPARSPVSPVMSEDPSGRGQAQGLRRSLSLADLVAITVGTTIGSGIFIVPASVLRSVALSPTRALVAWLIGGVLCLFGALTYGELGAMRADAGGLYAYIRDAFGRLPGFLYGWTFFFVIAGGGIGALAVAFASYLGTLIPLGLWETRAVGAVLIAWLAGLNVLGTRGSVQLQRWATGLKIAAIVGVSGFMLAAHPASAAVPPPPRPAVLGWLSQIGAALVPVFWAYEGWQYSTFAAGETRDPQRVFPRGLMIGTGILTAVYLLASNAYVAALGPTVAAASHRIAADAVSATIGPAAGRITAVAIMISILSAANGVMLTASRMYYSMARDGLFIRRLGLLHPRFGTPAAAILAGAGWSIILALTGTFEQLLTYVIFMGLLFYALGATSVFIMRARHPTAERPFRVPGYPLVPVIYIASLLALVVNTTYRQPGPSLIGLGITATGVPVYLLRRRH